MQTNLGWCRCSLDLEVAKDGIPHHVVKFWQSIALRRDPAPIWIIPSCGKAAGIFIPCNDKGDIRSWHGCI